MVGPQFGPSLAVELVAEGIVRGSGDPPVPDPSPRGDQQEGRPEPQQENPEHREHAERKPDQQANDPERRPDRYFHERRKPRAPLSPGRGSATRKARWGPRRGEPK